MNKEEILTYMRFSTALWNFGCAIYTAMSRIHRWMQNGPDQIRQTNPELHIVKEEDINKQSNAHSNKEPVNTSRNEISADAARALWQGMTFLNYKSADLATEEGCGGDSDYNDCPAYNSDGNDIRVQGRDTSSTDEEQDEEYR